MLPNGWKRVPLHEVAEVRTGIAKGKTNLKDAVEMPYLRVANVQDGHLNLKNVKTILVERSQVERYSLRPGDILMTEGGDFDKLGRGDVWRGQIPTCLHQNHVFAVRPNPKYIDSDFLSALAASEHGRNYFLSCAKRSTNLASINSTQLKAFPVHMPPLSEQRMIAAAIGTWDHAIETMGKLLANSRAQKQALISRLFVHSRHKDGCASTWSFTDFDAVFERVVRKNTVNNLNVLTISGLHGLVSQRDYFNKSVASTNLTGYTLLHRGEFAYNKSYSAGYPMGAIKPLKHYETGVVSSLYICFRFRDNVDADPDFFRHYFESGMLNEGISGIAQEGARNHGLLNVGVQDFFKLRLYIPAIELQRQIASALNMAEQREQLLEAQLAKLHEEKRALALQLLTGKRRLQLASQTEAEPA